MSELSKARGIAESEHARAELLQATVEHDAAYIKAQETLIAELEAVKVALLEDAAARFQLCESLEAENHQLRQALEEATGLIGTALQRYIEWKAPAATKAPEATCENCGHVLLAHRMSESNEWCNFEGCKCGEFIAPEESTPGSERWFRLRDAERAEEASRG